MLTVKPTKFNTINQTEKIQGSNASHNPIHKKLKEMHSNEDVKMTNQATLS